MKKIISLVVLLVAVIALTGCSAEELQTTIEENAASVATLTTDLASAQSDLDAAEASLATAIADLDTAIADLDTAEATLVTLQSDLDAAETALTAAQAVGADNAAALAAAVTDLEAQIDAVEATIATIEANIVTIETSITEIEANITTIEVDITALETALSALEADFAATTAELESAISMNEDAIAALEAKYSEGTYVPGTYVGTYIQTEDINGVETDVTYYAIVAVDRNGNYAGAYVDATWYVLLEDQTDILGYTIDTMTISNQVDSSSYTYNMMSGDVTGVTFWKVKASYFDTGFAHLHEFDAPSGLYDYTDTDVSGAVNTGDVFEREAGFITGINLPDFEGTNTVTITMTSETTATVDYLVNYTDGAAVGTYLEGTADATDITLSPLYFTWYESRLASSEDVTLTDQDAIDNAVAAALGQAEITDPNYEFINDTTIGDYTPGVYVIDFDEKAYNVYYSFEAKYLSEDFRYEGKLIVIIDENGNLAGAQAFMFTPLAHDHYVAVKITDLNQEFVYESSNPDYSVYNLFDTAYEQQDIELHSFTDNAGKFEGTAEAPVEYSGEEYYITYSYPTTTHSPDGSEYDMYSYENSFIKLGDDYVSAYAKYVYDSTTETYTYYKWESVQTLGPDGLPDTGDEETVYQWVEKTYEDGTNFHTFVSATLKTQTNTYTFTPLYWDYFPHLNEYIYDMIESHGTVFADQDASAALRAFWLYVEAAITAE